MLFRSPLDARLGALVDQVPLKLGEPCEDRQQQPTVRGGGVAPGVGKRAKRGAGFAEQVEGAQQVKARARQAVEPCDDDGVAWLHGGQQARQLRSVGTRSRGLLAVNLGGARGAQLLVLQCQILIARRDPGIAKHRHCMGHL